MVQLYIHCCPPDSVLQTSTDAAVKEKQHSINPCTLCWRGTWHPQFRGTAITSHLPLTEEGWEEATRRSLQLLGVVKEEFSKHSLMGSPLFNNNFSKRASGRCGSSVGLPDMQQPEMPVDPSQMFTEFWGSTSKWQQNPWFIFWWVPHCSNQCSLSDCWVDLFIAMARYLGSNFLSQF